MKVGESAMRRAVDTIKYYLSTGWYMMGLHLQGQMEYPTFLIGWTLANALQFAVGMGTLAIVTQRFQSINGWGFQEIAFMYGIGIISHALSIILFIQTWYIDGLAIYGGFDRMLLRPMNVYYQFCIFDLNLIGLTDLIPGIVIFIYGAIAVSFKATIANILLLVIIIIGATLIRGGIFTAIGSVGFWTRSSRSLIDVTLSLFDRANMYPLTIYNAVVQALLTFALPLGFMAFYPAQSFLGKQSGEFAIPGIVPLWGLLAGILCMVVGNFVFRRGLRRYDSSGS